MKFVITKNNLTLTQMINMNKISSVLLFTFTCIIFMTACKEEKKRPTTAMDTARTFISASLDGDITTAESLLLKDTENIQLFNMFKDYHRKLPEQTKKKYEAAEYKINSFDEVNDSTVIVNYSNDYMHQPMNLRVIKKEEQWFIDFKFISSTTDSLKSKP